MKRIAILALIILAGCQTPAQIDAVFASGKQPTPALRAYLAQEAKSYLLDPYSVRDTSISGVMNLDNKGTTSVCIRGVPKNAYGAYIGMQTVAVRMVNGKAVASFQNQSGCSDPRLTWYPYPELEAL